MGTIQIIADMLFSKGYTVIIDQTNAGYIYMGYSLPKTKITEGKWGILRWTITESDLYIVGEWANGEGNSPNKIWNSRTGYTFNYDI